MDSLSWECAPSLSCSDNHAPRHHLWLLFPGAAIGFFESQNVKSPWLPLFSLTTPARYPLRKAKRTMRKMTWCQRRQDPHPHLPSEEWLNISVCVILTVKPFCNFLENPTQSTCTILSLPRFPLCDSHGSGTDTQNAQKLTVSDERMSYPINDRKN